MRATAAASDRPRPEPGRERAPSSRTKRSSTRARSSGGMPGPRSATSSDDGSAARARRHDDRPVSSRRPRPSIRARHISAHCRSDWRSPGRSVRDCPRPSAAARRRRSARRRPPRRPARRVRRRWRPSRRRRRRSRRPRSAPASARAIISSALKTLISPSDSSIVRLERGAIGRCIAAEAQRLLGVVAQPGQRRAQDHGRCCRRLRASPPSARRCAPASH